MTEHQPPPAQGRFPAPPPGRPHPGPAAPWSPQQPPHAVPVEQTFPHAEPTPYHAMLRTWTYAWWKPVVGMVVAGVAFVLVTAIVFVLIAGILAIFQSGAYLENLEESVDFSDVGPEALLGLNLALGSMILVTWAIIRVLHGMRPRWLSSVVPRMRWRFFGACLGLAVVALAAQILVAALLPDGGDADFAGRLNDFTTTTALLALVVLLTTPLQAAGEEYLFRGYLLQAVGSLSGNRWVAIVVTAVLFALAHGGQNFPLFFDRLAFGLIAAWLVIRTGGLEAGIALHVLNNLLAFGLALSFGDVTETLNISEASWWNIALTVTQSAVYAGLVLLVAHRMGLQTHTRPPSQRSDVAPSGTVGGDLATA